MVEISKYFDSIFRSFFSYSTNIQGVENYLEENKKILSYFGLAVGLGLVGAMVYFALSNKGLNVDKTSVVLGEEEPETTDDATSETTLIYWTGV